jgi:hypothetical protein
LGGNLIFTSLNKLSAKLEKSSRKFLVVPCLKALDAQIPAVRDHPFLELNIKTKTLLGLHVCQFAALLQKSKLVRGLRDKLSELFMSSLQFIVSFFKSVRVALCRQLFESRHLFFNKSLQNSLLEMRVDVLVVSQHSIDHL